MRFYTFIILLFELTIVYNINLRSEVISYIQESSDFAVSLKEDKIPIYQVLEDTINVFLTTCPIVTVSLVLFFDVAVYVFKKKHKEVMFTEEPYMDFAQFTRTRYALKLCSKKTLNVSLQQRTCSVHVSLTYRRLLLLTPPAA